MSGFPTFLGAEIEERIGNAGSKAVLGVILIVVRGLVIKAGLSSRNPGRQVRSS